MTDSAPPDDAPPPDRVASPAVSRWAKLWGQLKRFRGPIAAIAAFGAVLSGFLGYWSAYQTVQKVVVPQPVAVTADAGPLSIVVLPFTNLTGDASQAYVADGLTASLTSDLSRIRDAFIVDAKTAFAYKDKPLTAQQVGRELGVHFVLQGTVQRSGTKIRINAQLADANSNAQLWSDTFEGDQSDLFALQDRVTTLVGNSIGREMVIVAARESETHKSSSKVADLMLRAKALGLNSASQKNLQQQQDLFRQVLALEPNNASAMVGLGGSLATEASNFDDQMDESVQEKKYVEARDLALRAKELDPENPGVYLALGSYASSHGDRAGYLRALETQLSLDPKNPSAYNNLAVRFYFDGEPQKSIELLTQAINLDPKYPTPNILSGMGRAYFMLGDNDAAIEWIQKCLETNPGDFSWYEYAFLAMAYANKGDDARARTAAGELRRLNPNIKLSKFVDKPDSSTAPAYKEWYDRKLVPGWRKAGLPE
jgi:TolB-like protein/cytochrome c-type biogenesis protein CcmH/NrfG